MGALSAPLSVRSDGVPINHKPSMTRAHWTTSTVADTSTGRACVAFNLDNECCVQPLDLGDTDFGSNPGAEVQPEWSQAYRLEWG